MSISPKLVHLVFKTHLDIGFTDLAARVTENYIQVFIPGAIETAAELRRRGGREALVWTTGSWLIHTALKKSGPRARDALIRAIEAGDIAWHALPFTSHTELMDRGLFEYGLSLSAELDRRFGKTTVAAKMTDVPGHTIGMIPLLAKAGVEYLHIGVNGASRLPETPRVFRWRAPEGGEVIVQYDRSYGDTLILPGLEEALVIVNNGDNMSPPRTESVLRVFADLAARFPGAEIRASTLDGFVPALRKIGADLPVLTEEIGDTWIHGVGTDPAKVARFRELLRLRKVWEAEGRLSPADAAYGNFYDQLIMISEHTWGLDLKKHLGDFKNWQAEDFKAARQADTVSPSAVPEEYGAILVEAEPEAPCPGGAGLPAGRTYSFFESSHREQRGYLDAAVAALPPALGEEAAAAFRNLEPRRSVGGGEALYPGQPFTLGPWQALIGDSGAIVSLRGERELAGSGGIGDYSYQTFSYEDFVSYHQDYNRDMDTNAAWAIPDFGKPGMQYARPRPLNAFYRAHIRSISRPGGREDTVELRLLASPQDPPGAPRELVIRYRAAGQYPRALEPGAAPPRLEISLDWFDKEASRLPEALWFGISLNAATPSRWRFRKLGVPVNPLDVVKGGNRSYHAVTGAEYSGSDGRYLVSPLDSPLAALGKPKMLRFDERFEDPAGGLYFNIFNNIWGTNFPMWLEGEGRSRFVIEFFNPSA